MLMGRLWIPLGVIGFALSILWFLRRVRILYEGWRVLRAGWPDNRNAELIQNFVRYCKAFLEERCRLNSTQAQLLVVDPELGPPIEDAKRRWVAEDLTPFADPDDFLVSKRFDAPEMQNRKLTIDREYVDRMLSDIVKDHDLSRFIL